VTGFTVHTAGTHWLVWAEQVEFAHFNEKRWICKIQLLPSCLGRAGLGKALLQLPSLPWALHSSHALSPMSPIPCGQNAAKGQVLRNKDAS
jgi:hypothetical protein